VRRLTPFFNCVSCQERRDFSPIPTGFGPLEGALT
jgi:hypothetical protein